MKSRLIAIATAVSIAATLLIFTIALADPADPFSASAEATAVDASISIDLTLDTVNVGILVGQQTSQITGTASAVETGGSGLGVLLTEDSFLDFEVQAIATESYTDTTAPGNDTDTDFLASVSSLILDTAVISSTSESESLDPRFTTGEGVVNNLEVGTAAGSDILDAATISETAHTESSAGGSSVTAMSAVSIEDLSSEIFFTDVFSATAITSSAEVYCDDFVGGESATTDYNFVDLTILGQDITVFTPGTQVTATVATVDVAVITLGADVVENVTAFSADASVVPLRLEFIANLGVIEAGTVIDIGAVSASCNVSQATAITYQGMDAQQQPGLPLAAISIGFIALAISTMIILRRRRTVNL